MNFSGKRQCTSMKAPKRGKDDDGYLVYECDHYSIYVEEGGDIDDFLYEAFNYLFASGSTALWVEKADIKEFRKEVKGILIH